uniref:NADH-ubiquinone oxidoreductase chain 6 n=1 Tax=Curculionoidea sp. 19 KM-2017 TaxID=2219402 RepID=A0A346RIP1_9CUCU|nr:NADH dehydrogenase subunit 6 [Curculionoidea sp. 19 KM-2017]
MFMMILFMNILFSIMFSTLNHPLSLGAILLIQTLLISMSTSFLNMNFWFGYILMLIMIGGMMIMFIYMTSIASNEKFSLPKNKLMILIFISMLTMIFYPWFSDYFVSYMPLMMQPMNSMLEIKFILNKFFSFPNLKFMMMMMIYLLITLIAIVKITSKNKGPFRQK